MYSKFRRRTAIAAAEAWVNERLLTARMASTIFPAMANAVMMYAALGYPEDYPQRAIARRSVLRSFWWCTRRMSRLVVDLSETTFMDSTGLGVLVNGLRQTGRKHGKLVVGRPTERIMRPFEITGLHNHLPIVKTRAEALLAF